MVRAGTHAALADVPVGEQIPVVAGLVVHGTGGIDAAGVDGARVLGAKHVVIAGSIVGLVIASPIHARVDRAIEGIDAVVIILALRG